MIKYIIMIILIASIFQSQNTNADVIDTLEIIQDEGWWLGAIWNITFAIPDDYSESHISGDVNLLILYGSSIQPGDWSNQIGFLLYVRASGHNFSVIARNEADSTIRYAITQENELFIVDTINTPEMNELNISLNVHIYGRIYTTYLAFENSENAEPILKESFRMLVASLRIALVGFIIFTFIRLGYSFFKSFRPKKSKKEQLGIDRKDDKKLNAWKLPTGPVVNKIEKKVVPKPPKEKTQFLEQRASDGNYICELSKESIPIDNDVGICPKCLATAKYSIFYEYVNVNRTCISNSCKAILKVVKK